eukprot:Cvel_21580.t1-p1 / transcript=Cvel_21580.t1 / gene=Cvel_21580 / organism=Chromera_velia_CCMP2878 / gene_product=hypothetical protein / transcript_product=hypothetical protein / location=Cvel_scaffold2037:4416-4588(-) / protein_length=57 / sequence_SO=supercontig / SO=protein_coding / is_pseudo=false
MAEGCIKHVVLFKAKADADKEQLSAFESDAAAFKEKIPVVTDAYAGETFTTDRAQGW